MSKQKKEIIEGNIIINKPEMLTPFQKGFEWTIASIGWILWFFICRPLIILGFWILGFSFFRKHMVILQGLEGLKEFTGLYIGIILAIVALIVGWNVYNRMCFKNKGNRRNITKLTSNDEIAQFLKMNVPREAEQLKSCNHVEIDFNKGNVLDFFVDDSSDSPIQGYFKSQ